MCSEVSLEKNLGSFKETTLERAADFMFVTAEKERGMFVIFFLSSLCQLLSCNFKLG